MESKLMEKKAIIEVLESIVSGMEWPVERKQEEIKRYRDDIKTDKENGVEIDPDDWRLKAIAANEKYLAAYESVIKHLEKLI